MDTGNIALHYGDQLLRGFIPQAWIDEGRYLPLVLPPKSPPISNPAGALASALEEPIGETAPFGEIVRSSHRGGNTSILVDDNTRPNLHTRLLLPLLIERLKTRYDILPGKIMIIVCTGTHRPPTGEELQKILGKEIMSNYKIVIHDSEKDLAPAGEVEGRTVKINSVAFHSDIIIPLTDIDNHYFAGVAGGPKAFCPGICDKETITWEHLHMFSDRGFADNVGLGILDGNPVYETKRKIVGSIIETMKKKGSAVYCLTAIMDPDRQLVYLRGGEIFAAHRKAAERLKGVWTAQVKERPGVVIAGAQTSGINLYQAGKALHAAFKAVKSGGHIMLAAPCRDSFGNEEYRKLMLLASEVLERESGRAAGIRAAKLAVLDAVKKNFRIGKQKAVDFFLILEFVGWGHLHMIQEGMSEADKKILPFAFWGDGSEPAQERLARWVERFAAGETISVIDNPGYLVKVM